MRGPAPYPAAARRPGFSLMEITAVMAAMALIGTLLTVVLAGALKLEKAGARTVDRLATVRELADEFRADVAQAADAPPQWQEETAGPTCLILTLDGDRHVVYRAEEAGLVRLVYEGENVHRRPVGPKTGATAAFERPPDGGRLITLRLLDVRKDGITYPFLEIAAALGGDRE